MKKTFLQALSLALLLPSLASAEPATYKVDADHSGVGFTIRHFVSNVSGRFRDFDGTVKYDKANPAASSLLVMSASLGPSIPNVVIAISIPIIPRAARVVRATALSIKENVYVEAAHGLGATHYRVIRQHLLPNVLAPYLIILTAQLGTAILAEAALSYLGLGAAEPTPSWGLMLSGSAPAYAEKAPWIGLFPGVAISLAVFGFSLFGDSLRDVLDPKLRGR